MTKPEPGRNQKVYARSTSTQTARPTPPHASPDVVWDLIDRLVAENPEPVAPNTTDAQKQRRGGARRRRKRTDWRRVLDVTSLTLWAFVVVKLFIGDLDRAFFAVAAPQALWILDFRWLLVLVLAALLLLLFKSHKLGLSLAYVVGFPLVLLCWKLPKFLVKKRSSLLVVGLAGISFSIGSRTRPFTVALAVACLSGFMIYSREVPWVIAGISGMVLTLIWWLSITTVDLLRSAAFIRAQKKFVNWALEKKLVDKLPAPVMPDRVTIKSWTAEDAKKYRDSAGYRVLLAHALQFWAACIDDYRKGPSVVILNVMAALSLTFQIVLAFAFINQGVYSLVPSQYSAATAPDWWTFVYYSAAGAYFGEISALAPVGALAIIAKLLNGILGVVVVGTVITSIVMNYRSDRADRDTDGVMRTLSKTAADVERTSATQYQMSFQELETRLFAAGWGLLGVAHWLAARAEEQSEPKLATEGS